MLKKLKKVMLSGAECLPIVEGSKGIGFSNWLTAGSFARRGAVGVFSGVNPDAVDDNGEVVPMIFKSKIRFERYQEMIENSIKGIISQAKRAKDLAGNFGRIHVNVLWEMGGTERILNEALGRVRGLINGIVCGAGMPYRLGDIAAKYKVYYYPIVSSMRAFRALWARSFQRTKEWLGGIVYECPWRAGGHNGLTNSEDPNVPQDSYQRISELRAYMNSVGLENTPIIIAGGVWNIAEYEHYLDNPEIGLVAFQFGTRPMVVKESPVSDRLKQILLNLKEGDIKTNRFSPTGFYSSAANNTLLRELFARSDRQIPFSGVKNEDFSEELICGKNASKFYIRAGDGEKARSWIGEGREEAVKTPDGMLVFLRPETAKELKEDLAACHGCLSQCIFSGWSQNADAGYSTGKIPDFRYFCIQKALQNAKNDVNIEKQLLFSGNNGFRFAQDPLYKNNHIPTISELVDVLLEGK
ncbi:MAG: nitronate monooxygenase [Rickettsiales bacterium]|nr:nitronate monooxygenase [Rickettsiales bacterium]